MNNINEVVAGLRELDDIQLTQAQLTNREEAQSGFQTLKDEHVPGLGSCLRWQELLVAMFYSNTQMTGQIATEPHLLSEKERDNKSKSESVRLHALLRAHQRNCSHCRVFPQPIPWSVLNKERPTSDAIEKYARALA
jgi:hypothetical protein